MLKSLARLGLSVMLAPGMLPILGLEILAGSLADPKTGKIPGSTRRWEPGSKAGEWARERARERRKKR